jgi:hypothetical protein
LLTRDFPLLSGTMQRYLEFSSCGGVSREQHLLDLER